MKLSRLKMIEYSIQKIKQMKCGKTHFVEVLSRPELEITAEPETGRGLELDVRPLTFQKLKLLV